MNNRRCVQDGFLELAHVRPERLAISSARRSWTYGELERASRNVAVRMLQNGVRAGEVVVIDGDRSAELIVLLLAVMRIGAVFLVLGERWPDGYKLTVTTALRSLHWATAGVDRTAEPAVRQLAGDKLKSFFALSPTSVDEFTAEIREELPTVIARAARPMYLACTSGSTGRPKLVLGSHEPVVHFFDWYIDRFEFGSADRFSLLSGLGYDPMLRDIFTPLSSGGSVCVPSPEDLHTKFGVSKWLQKEAISVTHTTPSLAALIFDSGAKLSLPHLSIVAMGGEPLSWKRASGVAAMAPEASIVNFYGTTETPQAIAYHVVDASELRRTPRVNDQTVVPLGGPINDVDLLLLDSHNRVCGIADVGEICVRTRYHSQGYYGEPASTARSFMADPTGVSPEIVYRTGDLGYRNGKNEVVFVGRKDRQVKCGGNRVQLEEVESALREITGSRHVLAIVENAGEEYARLSCYIETQQAPLLTEEQIKRAALAVLPAHMIPRRFISVPALPLTPNGKLDIALRSMSEPKPEVTTTELAPQAVGLHAKLRAIWAAVLEVEQDSLTIDSNFFEAGGNSLMASRLIAAVNEAFRDSFAITDVFLYPKIRDWVKCLSARSRAVTPVESGHSRSEKRGNRIAAARAARVRG
jgi:amino acid adenylation domain-containing protein